MSGKIERCQTCEGEIVGGPHCGVSEKCKACKDCVCPDCGGCDDNHCHCGEEDVSSEDAEEESSE